MRVSLLLVVVAILSLLALVAGLPDQATHVDAMEQHELDLNIQQPARTTPRTTPRTPATRIRPRTTRPRTTRTGMMFPRDPFRVDPDTGMRMRMSPRIIRLSMLERRMLRRMFRNMLRMRMREMFGSGYAPSAWEMRVIRMMALRDMMMAMDVQAQEAAQLATMVDQREMDESETYDDPTETATEMEAEPDTESAHDIKALPEDTVVEPEMEDDPSLIESEFDISAPYGGGYGGFGYGGYGGGKKGYGYGGYGGYGKKAPFKKVPFKKVPFKKAGPFKKGYGKGY